VRELRAQDAGHEVVSDGCIGAVVGEREKMRELAVVERIEVHLAMLHIVLLKQAVGLEAVRNLGPDGVVGADGLVGRVPEPEGLFRDRDVEAAGEVAHGVAGGVPQVVAAHRLHNNFDRIRGVLGDQIDERVAAPVAAPALALLMAGFSRAFLDHGCGVAAWAAGDGWIDRREDNHCDASGIDASVVHSVRWMVKGWQEQKTRKRRVTKTRRSGRRGYEVASETGDDKRSRPRTCPAPSTRRE
jgi:hypothetical protein